VTDTNAKKAAKGTISVRMYNVGFGDCFLIRIPTAKGQRRVLVDCGYHSSGPGAFTDPQLVAQIKKDLDGEGLDVVVATHRHQDHISGFGETELWKDVGVEEVWLPFTANQGASTDDPSLAAWERLIRAVPKLLDEGGKLRERAANAVRARTPEERERVAGAVAFMLWNARENAPGIANLSKGMKRASGAAALRRFLPEAGKDAPHAFETPALPGVRVHVLGPARDAKYRGKRTAPKSWGVAQDGQLGSEDGAIASPFGPEWQIGAKRLPGGRPFLEKSLQAIANFNADLATTAWAVDGFLNGESLVLMLELGKARLLLTGDAEVGSWMKILGDPDALAIASSATFLKVGHHGSHNATPLVFLKEHLAAKTPAAMSTQEGEGPFRRGIPRKEILDVLEERHMPLARSDKRMKKAEGVFKPGAGGKWIDCEIPF
jgi:beta-lactamase superfamily II metal-dependent hydrolase